VITALSASGFPSDNFSFFGYLPKSKNEREDILLAIQSSCKTTAIYESPNRLIKTLASIVDVFGPNHKIYIGLELTKRFESHFRGSVQRVMEQI
jgi:16S rRNA (cytidine1402-2'-O)-methyltransferase